MDTLSHLLYRPHKSAYIASIGKINGFSFSYRDIAFKASQLGKAYSWANHQKQLNYIQAHLEALRTDIPAKESAPAPAPAPAPAKDVAVTDIPRESISEKIAELEL